MILCHNAWSVVGVQEIDEGPSHVTAACCGSGNDCGGDVASVIGNTSQSPWLMMLLFAATLSSMCDASFTVAATGVVVWLTRTVAAVVCGDAAATHFRGARLNLSSSGAARQ